MAKTRGCRNITWPRRRVLIVSLLFQNHAAVELRETTAEPAPGATTRARSRRIAAAVAALPEEILALKIFLRLSVKDILRCRAVCRYWRDLTFAPGFLLAHHRRQPSLLLLTHNGTTTLDPIFQRGHPILELRDQGGFTIRASCDGLLLLSRWDGCFGICNPATHRCAPLALLTAAGRGINIAALYLHRPSGEYRILYWKGKTEDHLKAAYYILTVRQGRSPRCIGVPSDKPSIDKAMLAWNETTANNLAQPVVFCNCLHWDQSNDAGLLVFDTVVESFRFIRRPADASRLCTRLCDMEGAAIGFSCFADGRTVIKIWVLEDYEREVWSIKYHVKIPLWSFYNLEDTQHLVLSRKGDVLVYTRSHGYMFHYDNTGKLLEELRYDSCGISLIGPWFKESLVKYDSSLRQGSAWVGQLRFFRKGLMYLDIVVILPNIHFFYL